MNDGETLKKEKGYEEIRFSAEAVGEAVKIFLSLFGEDQQGHLGRGFKVEHNDATWSYDSFEEFIADYRKHGNYARIYLSGLKHSFEFSAFSRRCTASISAPLRQEIEIVFDVFEKHAPACKLPPLLGPEAPKRSPKIFIGHGRSTLWRDLKDHLHEQHGINVVAFETGARAGHSIRDILEELVRKSAMAFLVLTAEDEQADDSIRARQNVIHETGLFQGRLGFARAIVLREEGVEEFSNLAGIQEIRFSRGNIRETFGDVVATIRREFGASIAES